MKWLIAVTVLSLAAVAQTASAQSSPPLASAPSSLSLSRPTGTSPLTSATASQPATASTPATSSTAGKPAALPPGIDEGIVQDHQYSSDYFGFRFSFPEHLNVNEDFMAGAQDESGRSCLLFAASGGAVVRSWTDTGRAAAAQTLTIFADHLAAVGANDASVYMAQVTRPLFARQGFVAEGPTRAVTLAGHSFLRSDFTKQGTAEAVLVTTLRGYAVSFLVMAPSRAEVDDLTESFKTMEFFPGAHVEHRAVPRPSAAGLAGSKSQNGKP